MSIGRRNDLEFDIEVLLTFEPEKVVRVNKEYRPGPYGAS